MGNTIPSHLRTRPSTHSCHAFLSHTYRQRSRSSLRIRHTLPHFPDIHRSWLSIYHGQLPSCFGRVYHVFDLHTVRLCRNGWL